MCGIPANRNFKGVGVGVGVGVGLSCQPASRDSHVLNLEATVHMLVYIRDPISAVAIVANRVRLVGFCSGRRALFRLVSLYRSVGLIRMRVLALTKSCLEARSREAMALCAVSRSWCFMCRMKLSDHAANLRCMVCICSRRLAMCRRCMTR